MFQMTVAKNPAGMKRMQTAEWLTCAGALQPDGPPVDAGLVVAQDQDEARQRDQLAHHAGQGVSQLGDLVQEAAQPCHRLFETLTFKGSGRHKQQAACSC